MNKDPLNESIQAQLKQINQETLEIQRKLILNDPTTAHTNVKPYTKVIQSGNETTIKKGQELIRQGKVGCLIVAGGQATRLGLDAPKGTFPISNVKNKSLFQLFFEKCKAAGTNLPLAVMTSPLNHEQTVSFIKTHDYFGLAPDQVDFFKQSMLPFLDKEGQLFLENEQTIAQGPDGNGSSLECFTKAGLFQKWRQNGVEIVIYVLIDNPLADPFDAELAGTLALTHSDVVVKCTDRRNQNEKVGVIVEVNGKPRVIEYSELPSGSWNDLYANISLFAFTMDFIETVSKQPLPLHKAFKPAKSISGSVMAWKFEKFIFDVLEKAKRIEVLHYPRSQCFAPLKNKEGADSPEEVKASLLARDREIYRLVTGKEPPSHVIELSQQFYYPTPDLLSRWKGKDAGSVQYLN